MITFEQVKQSCNEFRKIMTDKRNPISRIDHSFKCLFTIVSNTDPNDPEEEKIQSFWEVMSQEWMMRKDLMIRNGHPLT